MAITRQDGYISAASSLLKWGVQIVVITRARSGASAMIKSELTTSLIEYQQPINPVAICDTTGAGDAFAGAFLAEWVSSEDVVTSLRAACVAGACAVSVQGASTMASKDAMRNIEASLFPYIATPVEINL